MKSWKTRPVPELPGTMPPLRIYDTSRGDFATIQPQAEQSMYVCGITPYDATHMGHAATYLAFDLLNRAWRDAGSRVDYVQNVTDVDDPLLERATATGQDWRELAVDQTSLFHEDMEALNVVAPAHYVGAVEAIPWIVPEIERLVASGLAYRVPGTNGEPDGDVYYDVAAADAEGQNVEAWELGAVSGLSEEEMLPLFAERGGDPDRPGKRNRLDPLLWRVARDGEPCWDGGSLGRGRPGWHIECTVIAQRFLPSPFTVQAGGSDLIFPHHEMGAGHWYSLTGEPMAKHYAHTGMVGLDGEKMSKSRGNLVLVSALRRQGVEPAVIRSAVLANHYRTDWFWTDELLQEAERRVARWREALEHAPEGSAGPLLAALRERLADDLDAPGALRALDTWADAALATGGTASVPDASLVSDSVNALLGVEL
ncbi:cysteine--1-D-myo-inosityl 2-amino-2-deoxy-alpha-D-glucopyranoside ligase [Arthrobacter woluwensis]|uniref:L-cysteine:1D-myo-inositol 2-amino-2-deoxy-alpha-D-glucopyranoside ligase n=1 Tax=Arthrobacter woluwensis TaxID=156980 RepID=A0A1H4PWU0_9MICC|nr:cysteine--1-D-myo-inosityl 2-amino-2-deoxy-alpha-D-glucopyranoside ligase [Arthrobacter woluwensis]SEC11863.1 L-cysteine:1D-myo-inositol 2-amino-2-deoxy-alpha-D-glucopyranoside ligase [Arthrobacter woluwensis]